jgi:Flp pilus assembly protein TadG
MPLARLKQLGRRGAVALEFAIVGIAFFTLVLGTMEFGFSLFVDAALDTSVQNAARALQVGAAARSSGQSLAAFAQSAICPNIGALLNCSQLYVSVTAIPSGSGQNYATYLAGNPASPASVTSSNDTVCTGVGGQLMLIRAYYLSPTFVGLLIPAFSTPSPLDSSQSVHASFASAGYVNEYFAGGETGC